MENTEYTLIRSKRKSLSVQIKTDGQLIVRAPLHLAKNKIDSFVREHEDWIRRNMAKVEQYQEERVEITDRQRSEGIRLAQIHVFCNCSFRNRLQLLMHHRQSFM